MKPYIIVIANQKGGVGKSTAVDAIGSYIASKGKRCLFIDLDPQGNLSYTMKANYSGISVPTAWEVLTQRANLVDAIQRTERGHIVASSPLLASADINLTMLGKEYRLKEALKPILRQYDAIIIDTPPNLGILTINALTAANGCIIPSKTDIFSLQGILQLNKTIEAVKQYCNNPNLQILGIALSQYSSRTIIGKEIAAALEQTAAALKTKLYNAKIRECTAIKEAAAKQESIFVYAPKSNASIDYQDLAEEALQEILF